MVLVALTQKPGSLLAASVGRQLALKTNRGLKGRPSCEESWYVIGNSQS
jgi:hypothetical protein